MDQGLLERVNVRLRFNRDANLNWTHHLVNVPQSTLDALVVNKEQFGQRCRLKSLDLVYAFKRRRSPDRDQTFRFLAERVLKGHPTIARLSLGGNKLTVENIDCLRDALIYGTECLVSLDLSHNHLGDAGVKSLVLGLQHGNNKKCKNISLANNRIGHEGCTALASLLCIPNFPLEVLALGGNPKLGMRGLEILAAVLRHTDCSLRGIRLNSNKLGDESATILASSLEDENCTLQELDLSSNVITDRGVAALSEGLGQNKKLKQLSFKNNSRIGDGSCQAMASLIRHSTSLQIIRMPDDYMLRIGPDGEDLLKWTLYVANHSLRELPGLRGLQQFCNQYCTGESRQAKRSYYRLAGLKPAMSSTFWPEALAYSGMTTKPDLMYAVLRDGLDNWMDLSTSQQECNSSIGRNTENNQHKRQGSNSNNKGGKRRKLQGTL